MPECAGRLGRTLLVTVADVPLLNVGVAFWGLLAGGAVCWLLERTDFSAEPKS
jgi:benzoate membrane transport protein